MSGNTMTEETDCGLGVYYGREDDPFDGKSKPGAMKMGKSGYCIANSESQAREHFEEKMNEVALSKVPVFIVEGIGKVQYVAANNMGIVLSHLDHGDVDIDKKELTRIEKLHGVDGNILDEVVPPAHELALIEFTDLRDGEKNVDG